MTDDERAALIMERMGFPPNANGPYVTELRKVVRRQVGNGMVNRSAGLWNTEEHPNIWNEHEERARCLLEVDWAIEHGHCHQTEVLDCYPINRRFSTRTMRWHYEFRPDRIAPWIRDQMRLVGYHCRVLRDRLLRRQNPYSRRS